MKLRDLITQALGQAGDLDEPVYIRLVTRNDMDSGAVIDSLTKVAKLARVSFTGCSGTVLTVECCDLMPEDKWKEHCYQAYLQEQEKKNEVR